MKHQKESQMGARNLRANGGDSRRWAAFTMIELLVVAAMLVLITAALLPALAHVQTDNRAVTCMNNTKRLTLAWLMYASDNQDRLLSSSTWIDRYSTFLDWGAAAANTNAEALTDPSVSPIAAYVKSATIFKCPADNYQAAVNGGPRVRSYSLNGALGGLPTVQGNGVDGTKVYYGSGYYATVGIASKMAHLNTPGPSKTFAMVDEHPDSINDGAYMFDPGYPMRQERWRDFPGSLHNGAGSFSFADGHSEIHRWVCQSTVLPVKMQKDSTGISGWWGTPYFVGNDGRDYRWLDDRMPYR